MLVNSTRAKLVKISSRLWMLITTFTHTNTLRWREQKLNCVSDNHQSPPHEVTHERYKQRILVFFNPWHNMTFGKNVFLSLFVGIGIVAVVVLVALAWYNIVGVYWPYHRISLVIQIKSDQNQKRHMTAADHCGLVRFVVVWCTVIFWQRAEERNCWIL